METEHHADYERIAGVDTPWTAEDEAALQGAFEAPVGPHTVWERCLSHHDTVAPSNEACPLCRHLLDWHGEDGRCNVCAQAIGAQIDGQVPPSEAP